MYCLCQLVLVYPCFCKKKKKALFRRFYHLLQVQAREREVQQTRDVKEDFSSRLQDIEAKLKTITLKLEDRSGDLEEAKEESKVIIQTD